MRFTKGLMPSPLWFFRLGKRNAISFVQKGVVVFRGYPKECKLSLMIMMFFS